VKLLHGTFVAIAFFASALFVIAASGPLYSLSAHDCATSYSGVNGVQNAGVNRCKKNVGTMRRVEKGAARTAACLRDRGRRDQRHTKHTHQQASKRSTQRGEGPQRVKSSIMRSTKGWLLIQNRGRRGTGAELPGRAGGQ